MSALIGIARKALTNLNGKFGATIAPYDPALKVLNCVFIYAIGLQAVNSYYKEKRFAASMALFHDKLYPDKGM